MMNLRELFQGPDGESSSTRFAFLLWVIWVLIIWSVASLRLLSENKLVEKLIEGKLVLPAIPESVIIILGILMTGKVVQRFVEGGDKLGAGATTTPTPNPTTNPSQPAGMPSAPKPNP